MLKCRDVARDKLSKVAFIVIEWCRRETIAFRDYLQEIKATY